MASRRLSRQSDNRIRWIGAKAWTILTCGLPPDHSVNEQLSAMQHRLIGERDLHQKLQAIPYLCGGCRAAVAAILFAYRVFSIAGYGCSDLAFFPGSTRENQVRNRLSAPVLHQGRHHSAL